MPADDRPVAPERSRVAERDGTSGGRVSRWGGGHDRHAQSGRDKGMQCGKFGGFERDARPEPRLPA